MVKRPASRATVERELTEAKGDLDSAKKSLLESDFKWNIIKAYYCIDSQLSDLFSTRLPSRWGWCRIRIFPGLFPCGGPWWLSPWGERLTGRGQAPICANFSHKDSSG